MSAYKETVRDLFDLQKFSIKMGLENITILCNHLNNPQNSFPTIHVAGTNGKGSTSAMIQGILAAHGLKTGLYTSPHLIDFRERIRVNSNLIPDEFIIDYWHRISALVYSLKATFFDTTTALAFDYFRDQRVDVAVIETGLGGRLDSTNIINSVAAVITPIAIDHIKQLGDQLEGIAKEKAAIIKKDATLFVGIQNPRVLNVLKSCQHITLDQFILHRDIDLMNITVSSGFTSFSLHDLRRDSIIHKIKLNLHGRFQVDNAALAYLASRWYLEKTGQSFSPDIFKNTLSEIHWPGRLQKISSNPDVIIDVSHNPAGVALTVEFISQNYNHKKIHLLFGLIADKEFKPVVKSLQKVFKKVVITEPVHERPLSGEILQKEFIRYGIEAEIIKDVQTAYRRCLKQLPDGHTLFIIGSHYIAGKIIEEQVKLLDMVQNTI